MMKNAAIPAISASKAIPPMTPPTTAPTFRCELDVRFAEFPVGDEPVSPVVINVLLAVLLAVLVNILEMFVMPEGFVGLEP